MSFTYEDLADGVRIYLGDCLEVLPTLEPNSVDSVICDPPYGLEFMGKEWDRLWNEHDGDETRSAGRTARKFQTATPQYRAGTEAQDWHYRWALAALRVAKPGAHLLAFGGTRTFHRLACAIEDAGWEIRDTVMWVYGSGFPKSLNLGNGWGTALKPAWEPVIVARKPLEGTVSANVQKWGTGALNIDGGRVGIVDDATVRFNQPGSGLPDGRKNHSPIYEGGWAGNYNGSKRPHPDSPRHDALGRWPANLIHDGSEEVVERFPANARAFAPVRRGHNGKSNGIYGDFAQKGDDGESFRGDSGSAARFFYCAKASKAERDAGCEDLPISRPDTRTEVGMGSFTEKGVLPGHNAHPTVKPVALMRYLCRLVTPPGGLVLDPFTGSGSTGIAALAEGFRFVGIEREAEYCDIARGRISNALMQGRLPW